jgi:hypothetical protein
MSEWNYGQTTDSLSPSQVALRDVLVNPEWQVRTRLDAPTVRRYADIMARGQDFPAIKVARIGGNLFLVDGAHRMEAARLVGRIVIQAEIVEGLSEAEARWEAACANLCHGLPLKSKEHRAVFRAFVKAEKHRKGRRYLSYRDMATELGGIRAHTTLRNWMQQDFPKIAKAMGDDGASVFGGRGELPGGRLIDSHRIAIEAHVRGLRAFYDSLPEEERRGFYRDLKRVWRDESQTESDDF